MQCLYFIDSNIIIESVKEKGLQQAKEIINIIKYYPKSWFNINSIVKSEVLYILGFRAKLPIAELITYLNIFSFLNISHEINLLSDSFILKYSLKPNGALILATCKHYNLNYLISLDDDFKKPCREEGITLIDFAKQLKHILDKSSSLPQ